MPDPEKARKILHIDMDCFYAAIEMRERPELAGKPIAAGGNSGRGVLTSCNYEARNHDFFIAASNWCDCNCCT